MEGVNYILILVAVLAVLNSIAALCFLLYGINAFWLTATRHAQRSRLPLGIPYAQKDLLRVFAGAVEPQDLPVVTVQLPIFNELYVARRLVEAVCALDYPRDRLQVQVLDDSTDETQEILQQVVSEYEMRGYWVEYLHREHRAGFKAGALQAAMPSVQGNYIAIFDADFVPGTDWLKQAMGHFLSHPQGRIAVVQTRWAHLNAEYSLLTQLQSVNLDGHFVVEQQSRFQNGYLLNFNGTAGIWYKPAIEDSGGWHADTLAEDIDLSYRAQLRGWQIVFDPSVTAPAELPVAIAAFKLQQFRWAKGGMQCAKKLLGAVWGSSLPWMGKWQATVHLTSYALHPLMLVLVLTSVPLMIFAKPYGAGVSLVEYLWGWLMLPATFGPPLLYLTGQRDLYPKTWRSRAPLVFLLVLLGMGISWSNTKAVLAGLLGTGANFRRTPKFAIRHRGDRWQHKQYRIPLDGGAIVELLLCAYSCGAIALCLVKGFYVTLPFMVLYAISYGYVGGLTLWQSRS
ncbi:MAG: glycosyltransferase [Oscillatoriales cyanobacterium SM2_2_1]|nr:glycosyltransferase [Oscillatoriales cyanobacterium SM2_2_1]